MAKLTVTSLSGEIPQGDISNVKDVNLQSRSLAEIESLEACKALRKLDLKDNSLTSLACVAFNLELTWLSAQKNRIAEFAHLENLSNLVVLNLGENKLRSLPGIGKLTNLATLLVQDNEIGPSLDGLKPLKKLQTLVASRNRLEVIELKNFPALKKLSLGHNRLAQEPKLVNLPALSELRLNGNKLSGLAGLGLDKLGALRILELGENRITSPQALTHLPSLLQLDTLSLRGNPLPAAEVIALASQCRKLRTLDSFKLAARLATLRQEGQEAEKAAANNAGDKLSRVERRKLARASKSDAAPGVASTPASEAPIPAAASPQKKPVKKAAKKAAKNAAAKKEAAKSAKTDKGRPGASAKLEAQPDMQAAAASMGARSPQKRPAVASAPLKRAKVAPRTTESTWGIHEVDPW